MQPQKREKQVFLNIKNGEIDEPPFRNLNSFLQ